MNYIMIIIYYYFFSYVFIIINIYSEDFKSKRILIKIFLYNFDDFLVK